jgi:glycosyltransferase involved in cell wall biosynthesis
MPADVRAAAPLRVLHAIDSLRVGGAQLLLGGLLDELQGDGSLESHLLVISGDGADDELVAQLGARAASVTMLRPRGLGDARLFRDVSSVVRRVRPKVIHSHLIDANVTTRIAARRARVPHLTTLHIPPFPLADSGRARTVADGATARLSTRLVAVSRHTADAYARAFRLRRRPIEVIPNAALGRPPAAGFDRASMRAALGAGSGPLVACISRLEPHKGIDVMIAAASELRGRLPGIRVVVAGDGSDREHLQRRAAQLGLNGTFELLGTREDVGEILAAADAFCMPSRHEGSPISLIEAMHAGLPCAVTTAGGMPEMVVDGESGAVAPAGDVDALARALERAIDAGTAMGRRAATEAAGRYTPAAMAAAYLAIYRELA